MADCKELAKKIKPELNVDDEEALGKAFKFQGQDNLYTFLSENNSLVEFLETSIKEMLGG